MACSETNVKSSQIQPRPEAHLYYPGSQVVKSSGRDESWGIDSGTYAAYWQVELKAKATPTEIYDWYHQELTSNGWTFRKAASGPLGSPDSYSKGTQDLFLVWAGDSKVDPGTYTIQYHVVPAPCASDPPPIDLGNCA